MKIEKVAMLLAILLIIATVLLSFGKINPTGDVTSANPSDGVEYNDPPFFFYLILVVAGIILLVLWYYFHTLKKEFSKGS